MGQPPGGNQERRGGAREGFGYSHISRRFALKAADFSTWCFLLDALITYDLPSTMYRKDLKTMILRAQYTTPCQDFPYKGTLFSLHGVFPSTQRAKRRSATW